MAYLSLAVALVLFWIILRLAAGFIKVLLIIVLILATIAIFAGMDTWTMSETPAATESL